MPSGAQRHISEANHTNQSRDCQRISRLDRTHPWQHLKGPVIVRPWNRDTRRSLPDWSGLVFGEVVRRSVVSMDVFFARVRVCRDIPTANTEELAFFAGTLSRCVVVGMSAPGRGFHAGVFDNVCGASALELPARDLVPGWVTAEVMLSARALMAFREAGEWHLKSGLRSISWVAACSVEPCS